MIFECAVDGHHCPSAVNICRLMEEMLTAEKHQKHSWAVMRQLQK